MTKSAYDIIKNIMMTEKCSALKDANKYAFRVAPDANKRQIADAVEQIYGVKVQSVNLMNYTGKLKRAGKSPVYGRRSNWKKAVVSLSEGTIELA